MPLVEEQKHTLSAPPDAIKQSPLQNMGTTIVLEIRQPLVLVMVECLFLRSFEPPPTPWTPRDKILDLHLNTPPRLKFLTTLFVKDDPVPNGQNVMSQPLLPIVVLRLDLEMIPIAEMNPILRAPRSPRITRPMNGLHRLA